MKAERLTGERAEDHQQVESEEKEEEGDQRALLLLEGFERGFDVAELVDRRAILLNPFHPAVLSNRLPASSGC